jgi:hypothetical protein
MAQSLSDVFSKLQVTNEQGASILQRLAKDMRDTDEELSSLITKTAMDLLTPQTSEASSTRHTTAHQ